MKKSLFFIVCCTTLLLSSCATYKKDAAVFAIGGNSINTYISAELDYDNAKPIEAVIETTHVLGLDLKFNKNKKFVSSNRYKGLNKRESQALYKAIEENNVDIVVEPRFEVETHSWFLGIIRTSKIKVKGWGLNIKRIKEDNGLNSNMPFPSSAIGGILGF